MRHLRSNHQPVSELLAPQSRGQIPYLEAISACPVEGVKKLRHKGLDPVVSVTPESPIDIGGQFPPVGIQECDARIEEWRRQMGCFGFKRQLVSRLRLELKPVHIARSAHDALDDGRHRNFERLAWDVVGFLLGNEARRRRSVTPGSGSDSTQPVRSHGSREVALLPSHPLVRMRGRDKRPPAFPRCWFGTVHCNDPELIRIVWPAVAVCGSHLSDIAACFFEHPPDSRQAVGCGLLLAQRRAPKIGYLQAHATAWIEPASPRLVQHKLRVSGDGVLRKLASSYFQLQLLSTGHFEGVVVDFARFRQPPVHDLRNADGLGLNQFGVRLAGFKNGWLDIHDMP
jgi:hypothetical protein